LSKLRLNGLLESRQPPRADWCRCWRVGRPKIPSPPSDRFSRSRNILGFKLTALPLNTSSEAACQKIRTKTLPERRGIATARSTWKLEPFELRFAAIVDAGRARLGAVGQRLQEDRSASGRPLPLHQSRQLVAPTMGSRLSARGRASARAHRKNQRAVAGHDDPWQRSKRGFKKH
jgi:hypothetical protein